MDHTNLIEQTAHATAPVPIGERSATCVMLAMVALVVLLAVFIG